jgi:hypothetical protein
MELGRERMLVRCRWHREVVWLGAIRRMRVGGGRVGFMVGEVVFEFVGRTGMSKEMFEDLVWRVGDERRMEEEGRRLGAERFEELRLAVWGGGEEGVGELERMRMRVGRRCGTLRQVLKEDGEELSELEEWLECEGEWVRRRMKGWLRRGDKLEERLRRLRVRVEDLEKRGVVRAEEVVRRVGEAVSVEYGRWVSGLREGMSRRESEWLEWVGKESGMEEVHEALRAMEGRGGRGGGLAEEGEGRSFGGLW